MKAKYWQKGETLDYTPVKAVENGAVVNLSTRIGIAASDIAAGEQGSVHVVGVFEMAKDGKEIAMGAAVYYNEANDLVTATADGAIPAGYAVKAAAAADTSVLVKLLG